ncbi:MAG TPA: AsmA-like C-terminal region-containing protein [Blastocatellia bacterium]|nr:AsmA-like C-terminal region-containing protein [Blastocatellia bacterium]
MPRPGRWLLRLLLLFAVLVAAAIAVAPFIPLAPLKPAVESRLTATLGRPVSVGSVRLSLAGGPYLVIEAMTAKEDPAFGDGNFLEADQVRANLAVLPFALRRQIVIEALDLKSPRFTFVKNADGAWSWTTIGRARAAAGVAGRLEEFTRQAAIVLIAADASVDSINIESASVRLIDRSGTEPPETLYRNVALRADLMPQGQSRQVRGELRAQSEETDGAEILKTDMPFDLVVTRAAPQKLTVQGSIGPGPLETKNLIASSFKSSLDLSEDRLALDQMDLSLYDGNLTGRMEIDMRSRRFTAEGRVTNLNLDQAIGSKLQMPGQITGHVDAEFKLGGELRSFQETVPTLSGSGRLASGEMFIASANLSEQVARALRINGIGNMSAGTNVGSLQSDFQISNGELMTANLTIQQLDGLGEAKSDQGWLKVASPPSLNYTATVLLTPDATAQVKKSSPLIGMAVSILEVNNRVAVPVSVRGEVRNPEVQVDVTRIFR